MAIRHKRKNSTGYSWQSTDLVEGQIGLNIADGTLHFLKSDNTIVNIAPGGLSLTSLSVTDSGGDGSLSYNNTTGVFTYTGPSTTDYRAAFSAGTGISITDGVISATGGGGGTSAPAIDAFLLMGA